MESQNLDLHYIEKWLPEASVNYKDGRPAVKQGLIITVFFKDGHLPEVRRNMVECVDRFYEEFKPHLKKTLPTKKWTSITQKNYARQKENILNSAPEEIFDWVLSSATESFLAPDYSISMIGKRIFHNENNRSVIKIELPLFYLKEQNGLAKYQHWVSWISNTFKVESGYAGLSFVLPYDFHSMFPYEYHLAQRFPGVMVDSFGIFEGTEAVETLKGASWYNIIGSPWLAKLTGVNQLSNKFRDSELSTIPYNNGVIIKTGNLPPVLGEIKTENLPIELARINQIIRPARRNGPHSLHSYPGYDAQVFTEESTAKWFARFDSASDLLSEQEGTASPEDTRITCNTGEPAPHAGHWATIKNGLLRDIHVSEGQRMPPFKDRKEQEFNVTWSLLEREDKGSAFK